MSLQELLKHLKDVGDSTHTAIYIYLEKLNTLFYLNIIFKILLF